MEEIFTVSGLYFFKGKNVALKTNKNPFKTLRLIRVKNSFLSKEFSIYKYLLKNCISAISINILIIQSDKT
jgi:hypothetical protein